MFIFEFIYPCNRHTLSIAIVCIVILIIFVVIFCHPKLLKRQYLRCYLVCFKRLLSQLYLIIYYIFLLLILIKYYRTIGWPYIWALTIYLCYVLGIKIYGDQLGKAQHLWII